MSTPKLTLTSTLPLPSTSPTPTTIPRLGFGVYQSAPTTCTTSCLTALHTGYRHIDTAQYYGNETFVGQAIRSSGLQRSAVFVTTKILAAGGSVDRSYAKCVESVGRVDDGVGGRDGEGEGVEAGRGEGNGKGYVDLFLIHSPNAGAKARREMWGALERLWKEGRARAIGVSNFGVGHLEEMRGYAEVWPPSVNQIELHPWCQQRVVEKYCRDHGIVVEAYSPLVRNQRAHDPTLVQLAKKHGKTTAQVLIRYCLQKNWVPLPKSDTPSRIEENADVYGFELDEEDMETLDGLDMGDEGAIVQAVKNG